MTDYVQIQLSLECIGFNYQGFLVRIPGADPDDIARLYAFHVSNSFSIFFRSDVPPSIQEQIIAIGPEKAFEDHASVEAIFSQYDPCDEIRKWETYVLIEEPSDEEFPSVTQIPWQPMEHDQRASFSSSRDQHVITQEGEVVSSCVSVRENDASAECYTFTEPDYRRRGFGKQVTASWASSILRLRKIPLYSHAVDNKSSRKLASSLSFLHTHSLVTYV